MLRGSWRRAFGYQEGKTYPEVKHIHKETDLWQYKQSKRGELKDRNTDDVQRTGRKELKIQHLEWMWFKEISD